MRFVGLQAVVAIDVGAFVTRFVHPIYESSYRVRISSSRSLFKAMKPVRLKCGGGPLKNGFVEFVFTGQCYDLSGTSLGVVCDSSGLNRCICGLFRQRLIELKN